MARAINDSCDSIEFEIEFYEGIIKEAPDYVDALVLLGEAYSRTGLYRNGLEMDLRITALRPDDPIAHYNLACSYSLLQMTREALRSLDRSISLGYCDINHIANDPDLGYLHDSRRFHWMLRGLGRRLLKRIRNRVLH